MELLNGNYTSVSPSRRISRVYETIANLQVPLAQKLAIKIQNDERGLAQIEKLGRGPGDK